MAPEQLAACDVTPRSDLYSLGLIFYEMVSGRRFYTAGSMEELGTQHRANKQPRLSVLAGQLDPAFERVIVQCLADDPQARPASARALLKSLPGGDPLDAAIAAGETPAPDTLAAAGEVGELSRLVAWAALITTLAGMALAVYLLDRGSLIPKSPPPKSPEILVERARDVLKSLGQPSPRTDWASAYQADLDYLGHVWEHDRSPRRWENLRNAALSPLYFFYRQSPKSLVAANRNGVVDRLDPPSDVPGMLEVVLDPQGRLMSYVAVPPRVESGGPWPDPEWTALFREPQLDLSTFHPATPEWTAPVDSDRKAAWEGAYPGMSGMAVRVEAAFYHGRPVWFAVLPPWAVPERPFYNARTEESPSPVPGSVWVPLILAALLSGGVLLVRRNLRRGRGDLKGSLRVALFVFFAYSLARLWRADHVSAVGSEVWLLLKVFAYPACFAALVWVFYMAVEPYARRLWPRILISWGRLLAGRVSDPMVGRDALLGMSVAGLMAATFCMMHLIPSWLGRPQVLTYAPGIMEGSLSSWRGVAFRILVNQHSAVMYALAYLLLLVLLRVVLRRNSLALGGLFVCDMLLGFGRNPGVEAILLALVILVQILLLVRCGLLGYCVMFYVGFVLTEIPYTLDASAWYATRGFVVLGLLAALAVYAFRTSLAGKPAFGGAWLEP